ncbi:MAG: RagB/SusD family nutrient uptake outer membrane protein [Paludibacter sp.]|nr:RagB/SusD family nutrient uptake outer membrane protein [Bacteroidales bacterium]MCM1069318.1 RagB/SusD family nutrient uptake outer membrane protein [Prevotella sp.]MCM1353699.1 RagB/SusD family nutrient uptake outer membrane protein [Bacteroides sp.]MCM1442233.1 RagB/SusD family nutrient uptake outer membrane protein [Muribaculum sp.]MCM1482195.1 RagB/SusD family nutrient uptake outer membrane protein [Paludibacter sp.]
MKTTIKIFVLLLAAAFGFTACVNDLNTQPIDPNVNQTFDQDAVFYKLYTSFVQTGQKGEGGDPDIITDDEGYSGFFRTLCVLNEFPTDAGWWTWRNDAGVSDLLQIAWTSTNPFVEKLYNRLNYGVTLANHFLDNTEGLNDEKTLHQRAEVRFIRALNYYHLLDMFGNVPFTTTVSMSSPTQIKRADLYKWLVEEINGNNGFVNDLYDRGQTTLYRATKSSAYMLLARLYLNAEVYTGTADWENAALYAQKVIDVYPTLHEPFAEIFMGDNDKTSAEEMVFLAACDGMLTRSYAGSQYTIASCRNSSMNDCGTSDNNWGCWRSCPELIMTFFPGKTRSEIAKIEGDEYDIPAIAGDDRAMFCQSTHDGAYVAGFQGTVPPSGDGFDYCWGICKWTNLYSDGSTPHDSKYVDTDVPLMRAAEAYMTLAEALYRQGKTDEAKDIIDNKIRARAHAKPLQQLNDEELLAEWLREFYHEGRRRIDLIRFGQFTGTNATMNWEGRAGQPSFEGNTDVRMPAKEIDAHYNIYPIPNMDIVANAANLTQNPGY